MNNVYKLKIIAILFLLFITLTSCVNHNQFSSGYVEVESGKLFYQSFGAGEPIIVVHGGPGLDQSYLLPQMLELAKDHQVVFYDQRGSGKSLEATLDARHVNLSQFAEDLEKIRQKFVFKKVTLIGHSWGGQVSMSYAIRYPQRVKAMVLLSSAPANFKGQQAFLDEFAIKTNAIKHDIAPLYHYDDLKNLTENQINSLYRKLASVYFANPNNVSQLTFEMKKESILSGFKVASQLSKTAIAKLNLFPGLVKLDVPTLIVHGNQDIMPVSTDEEIKAAISNSEIVYLDQCGHFPYIEQPEKLFSLINEFIKKVNTKK